MRALFRPFAIALSLGLFVMSSQTALSQISWTGPPKADKHRRKAAEGFAPLPLPVTPLRRTEKKRPPAPPTLMAEIDYGSEGGRAYRHGYSATTPGDTKEVFRYARVHLGVNYRGEVMPLDRFNYEPERVPIVYFSGRKPIKFSNQEKARLRAYLEAGGTIFADMSNGSPEFANSFRVEMQSLFPNRPWRRLSADHPLFHSQFHVNTVSLKVDGQTGDLPPHLEGINLGFRTAVMFSPYAVDYGWNEKNAPKAGLVSPEDSRRIGVNLLAYVLAYYRIGRIQSVATVFSEPTPGADDIAIAQLRHNGDWDPDPSGLSYLLRAVGEQTTGDVKFRRAALDPEDSEIFQYPFLYLTGQYDFSLTARGRKNLRACLERGGFLLIVNGGHWQEFDRATRRELSAIFPKRALQPLDADHALFTALNKAPARPVLSANSSAKPRFSLQLEGVEIDGRLVALYVPMSLGAAWQDIALPFVPTPDREYALAVGVNAVVYAILH